MIANASTLDENISQYFEANGTGRPTKIQHCESYEGLVQCCCAG